MTDPSLADGDRGCLRALLVVPLVVLTLIAAFFCWTALTIRPSGSWDHDASTGIVLSCVLTLGASGLASAMWLVPSLRRLMPWWWMVPALSLGVLAAVRWAVDT
ncbi:hypothetical protein [Streptomyces sp. NPDC005438]|uniref:hypothetical protein n=1 Tax=Streptomyces sp. NPDC005438 TaxID=3156880 RepID=UPI0033A6DD46